MQSNLSTILNVKKEVIFQLLDYIFPFYIICRNHLTKIKSDKLGHYKI